MALFLAFIALPRCTRFTDDHEKSRPNPATFKLLFMRELQPKQQQRACPQRGQLKVGAFETLHKDIGELVLTSAARALSLNKAYKVIVDEQTRIYGRDAHIKPLTNVWQEVPENQLTGVTDLVVAP